MNRLITARTVCTLFLAICGSVFGALTLVEDYKDNSADSPALDETWLTHSFSAYDPYTPNWWALPSADLIHHDGYILEMHWAKDWIALTNPDPGHRFQVKMYPVKGTLHQQVLFHGTLGTANFVTNESMGPRLADTLGLNIGTIEYIELMTMGTGYFDEIHVLPEPTSLLLLLAAVPVLRKAK